MLFQRTVRTLLVPAALVLLAPAAHAATSPPAAAIDAELTRLFPAHAPGAAVLVMWSEVQ